MPSIQSLDKPTKNSIKLPMALIAIVVAIALGGGTGYLITQAQNPAKQTVNGTQTKDSTQAVGIADKKTFKDQAEGILKEGGIEGEGSFHLERPGGSSKNVYLTSTAVDLSEYIGKKVRVWGETFQSEKAGWLMDVGLVEVL